MRKLKIFIKVIGVIILMMTVWFREAFSNSCVFLVKRGFYKSVSFTIQNDGGVTQSHFSVITQDPTYYQDNDMALNDIATKDNCF